METTEESSSSSELESDSSNSDYEDKDNSQSITSKTSAAAPVRTFENPTSFYEHCVHDPPAAATGIPEKTKPQAHSAIWRAARIKRVTASEAKSIFFAKRR